ncbi:MAG: LamG domain-containing protein, partial [Armatimonadetes bacterium]|nr:LamG domain-containing protein [Armatimonadota bacterium]
MPFIPIIVGGRLEDFSESLEILRDYDFTGARVGDVWTDRISGNTMPPPPYGYSIPFTGVANTWIQPLTWTPSSWGTFVGSGSFWFSLSFWVDDSCATSAQLINATTGSDGFQLLLTSANKLFFFAAFSAGAISLLSTATIVRETWNRVLIQVDRTAGKGKLYLNDDAVQEISMSGTGTISMGSVTAFRVGGGTGALVSFTGKMGGWQIGTGILSSDDRTRVLHGREIDVGAGATWAIPNFNRGGEYYIYLAYPNYMSDEAEVVDGTGCVVTDLGTYGSPGVRRFSIDIAAGNSLPAGFYGMKIKSATPGSLLICAFYRLASTSGATVGVGTSASAKVTAAGNGTGPFTPDGEYVYAGIYYAGGGVAADADFAVGALVHFGHSLVDQAMAAVLMTSLETEETDFMAVGDWLHPTGSLEIEVASVGAKESGDKLTLSASDGWAVAFRGNVELVTVGETLYFTIGDSELVSCIKVGTIGNIMYASWLGADGARIAMWPTREAVPNAQVEAGYCIVYDAEDDELRIF